MDKFVVLCRGDENEAELQVFGTFDNEEDATDWIVGVESGDNCPNDHEVQKIRSIRD